MQRRKQRGFSLIELLIVVAIILIIIAIAMPNYTKFKIHGNETAAMANLRSIVQEELKYEQRHHSYADLATLGTTNAFSINENNAVRSGYIYNVIPSGPNNSQFTAEAHPVTPGKSGEFSFCAMEDVAIRSASQSGAALDRESCNAAKVMQ